jgi:hypothetical protein
MYNKKFFDSLTFDESKTLRIPFMELEPQIKSFIKTFYNIGASHEIVVDGFLRARYLNTDIGLTNLAPHVFCRARNVLIQSPTPNLFQYKLITYVGESIESEAIIYLDKPYLNAYDDDVPFTVHSNQSLIFLD